MSPVDPLLDHFDHIAKCDPQYRDAKPSISVAIYRGFPSQRTLTAFTIGLSKATRTDGDYQELTISMEDTDDIWALAIATIAENLGENTSLSCGDTINFQAQISKTSTMSAFVVGHPAHFREMDCTLAIGTKKITIVELVPIYKEERDWLMTDGTMRELLGDRPRELLMNPRRESLIHREISSNEKPT
jgi:hypothetical protein